MIFIFQVIIAILFLIIIAGGIFVGFSTKRKEEEVPHIQEREIPLETRMIDPLSITATTTSPIAYQDKLEETKELKN